MNYSQINSFYSQVDIISQPRLRSLVVFPVHSLGENRSNQPVFRVAVLGSGALNLTQKHGTGIPKNSVF